MSIRYKACLVIKGYEQTDFGETYAPVRKLTTFRYLISVREMWMENRSYRCLPEGPDAHTHAHAHTPPIIVRLRKAHYSLKQAPQLWQDDINTFLLSSGSHNDKPTRASISTAMAFSSFSTIKICPRYHESHPSMAILHCNNDHGISLGQKAFITTILKQFHIQNDHEVPTPMVPNIELDFADGRGGEGTRKGECQALSSACRIIDVRSTCNAARYIIHSRSPLLIQFPSIH